MWRRIKAFAIAKLLKQNQILRRSKVEYYTFLHQVFSFFAPYKSERLPKAIKQNSKVNCIQDIPVALQDDLLLAGKNIYGLMVKLTKKNSNVQITPKIGNITKK